MQCFKPYFASNSRWPSGYRTRQLYDDNEGASDRIPEKDSPQTSKQSSGLLISKNSTQTSKQRNKLWNENCILHTNLSVIRD